MCKPHVHTIGKEKGLGKKLVRFQGGTPKMVKIGTAFQNGLQLLVWIDAMNNREKHEPSLNDSKSQEKSDTERHCERSEKSNNENHRVQKVKVLLKSFVLELPSQDGS